jgi:hypothetical protein
MGEYHSLVILQQPLQAEVLQMDYSNAHGTVLLCSVALEISAQQSHRDLDLMTPWFAGTGRN